MNAMTEPLLFKQGDREPWIHFLEYFQERDVLPKADYERRYGKFPRYFSGWYLFVPSKDLAEGELVHKKLNGLDLVAYRNKQGKPVVHANRCPHVSGPGPRCAAVK